MQVNSERHALSSLINILRGAQAQVAGCSTLRTKNIANGWLRLHRRDEAGTLVPPDQQLLHLRGVLCAAHPLAKHRSVVACALRKQNQLVQGFVITSAEH